LRFAIIRSKPPWSFRFVKRRGGFSHEKRRTSPSLFFAQNRPLKPGSVSGDLTAVHLAAIYLRSGICFRPPAELPVAAQPALQADKVCLPAGHPARRALLPHDFTLARSADAAVGGIISVATVSGLAPGRISRLPLLSPARTFLCLRSGCLGWF